MDEVRNPFAPGAGSRPPALAGRDHVIEAADIALKRRLMNRHGKSQILLGLRGTGKTVLLNHIEQMANDDGFVTSFIEAPDDKKLTALIYPRIHQALRKLSLIESSREAALSGMRALRGFASVFNISIGDFSVSVDPEPGTADSGNLEFDLTDLFIKVGLAAKAAGKGWALLIDELQYLGEEELSAIIVAIHRVTQKNLPIMFFGAGLPQIAGLSGEAKSYAERLFDYPDIGALSQEAARLAIHQPIDEEGESIDETALMVLFLQTKGYPYFLQEWGYQAWNVAEHSPITYHDLDKASTNAIKRLDEGFFRVRFDRLTPKERDYVHAMAQLGSGPYRSADVADVLKQDVQSLGPCRAKIINKGMIYSPSHGDIDFTVPLFEDYLQRMVEKINRNKT